MSKALQTLSPDECQRLLDTLIMPSRDNARWDTSLRNYTMAVVMLDTGLRVGELVQLQIADLWYQNSPVQSLCVRTETAKNHKSRMIPLTERLDKAVTRISRDIWGTNLYKPHCPAFYQGATQSALSTRQVRRIICRASTAALGRCVHPHVLRHTFATRLMEKTNIRVVQELLGHSSLSSTQIYTHPNNQDLKKAIEGLE